MAIEKPIFIAILVVVLIILIATVSQGNSNKTVVSSSKSEEGSVEKEETYQLEIKNMEYKLQKLEESYKYDVQELKKKIESLNNENKDLFKVISKTESMVQTLSRLSSDNNNSNNNKKEIDNFVPSLPSADVEKKYMKSQFGEDKYVYENFFKNPLKRNGFFLEVGALDGITFSNTYFFENALGWDGILIEATPSTAAKMMKNRNNSFKFNGGVCDQKKTIKFISTGLDAVNGNPDNMSEEFKEKFYKNKNVKEYEIECNTLTHYIRSSGRNHIDMMIVDIEGGEYDALKGFDFDTITVGVWIIEITEPELEKNKLLKQMLIEHGYAYKNRNHLSEIWINTNLYS